MKKLLTQLLKKINGLILVLLFLLACPNVKAYDYCRERLDLRYDFCCHNASCINSSEKLTEVQLCKVQKEDFSGDVVIPATTVLCSNQYTAAVVDIPYRCFSNKAKITSITIGDNVKTIGYAAFSGCPKLKSIHFGEKVRYIDDYSSLISGSDKLVVFTISPKNQYFCVVDSVLYNKSKDTLIYFPTGKEGSFSIPKKVKHVRREAFYSNKKLQRIIMTEDVQSIGFHAFSGCTSMTNCTIGDGVQQINEGAFYGCSKLTNLVIGNRVQNIGKSAFSHCSSLKNIIIPSSVQSIGDYAFSDCSSMTNCTIEEGVQQIESYAFSGCSSMTNCTIGEGVQQIESYAFYNCSSLKNIIIPSSVQSIGDYAFTSCNNLSYVICMSTNPPKGGVGAFYFETNNCPIYVPCGTLEAYQNAWPNLKERLQYLPLKYSVSAEINIPASGIVEVPYTPLCDTVITAIPNEGYSFVQWSDGVTDNPRKIELTQDTTFQAMFAINIYLVQFWGFNEELINSQAVEHGADAIAPEVPIIEHYNFISWDKAYTNVKSDLDIYAIYEPSDEAIEDVYVDATTPKKVLHDNHLYIFRGHQIFTIQGSKIR